MADSDRRNRFSRLAGEIARERRALDRVLGEVRSAISLLATRPPTNLEIRGAADLLHDYYTGAEKAFELIATSIDGGTPEGGSWHRRLLESMGVEVAGVRPPVLREATARALDEYLRFRHLFRSLYGFELVWERIVPLLEALDATHALVTSDLEAFDAFLEAVAR